jgi:hypothetical protein
LPATEKGKHRKRSSEAQLGNKRILGRGSNDGGPEALGERAAKYEVVGLQHGSAERVPTLWRLEDELAQQRVTSLDHGDEEEQREEFNMW